MNFERLLEETLRHFPQYKNQEITVEPIRKGGSDRHYYRLTFEESFSLVLMQYSDERKENRNFAAITEFLVEKNIRVPQIYRQDHEKQWIWLEDLGERDLHSYREAPWKVRKPYYKAALREIAQLHQLSEQEIDGQMLKLQPPFDEKLYQWEQEYFFEHYVGNYLGREIPLSARNSPELKALAKKLAEHPRRLVHRDFQSQNILIYKEEVYFIDYQGMRWGLPEYDVASLLYDPYVTLSQKERKALLHYYGKCIEGYSLREEVVRQCALQRLLQALGAYGNLSIVQGKASFLAHIPQAVENLQTILNEMPEMEELMSFLALEKS